MLDILFSQRFNNGIPRGISARERSFKVAHKTGSISRISHDAAIIEDAKGRRSILVVLTRGVPDGKRGEALVAKRPRGFCRAAVLALRVLGSRCAGLVRRPEYTLTGHGNWRYLSSTFLESTRQTGLAVICRVGSWRKIRR